ncbi:MAG: hypothetical protein HYX82_05955 [Chloroflexi bacterium]|nr:hypothetical protein [Chloroflexota bacterium]
MFPLEQGARTLSKGRRVRQTEYAAMGAFRIGRRIGDRTGPVSRRWRLGFTLLALAAVIGACGRNVAQAPQQAPPAAKAQRLAPPLPLTRQEAFRDLTERHTWTIRYPEGWFSSTTGSGRWIRDDPAGLVSVSLNQTTLQGAYTARTVIPLLLEPLPQRGYSNVQMTAINDLPGSVPGSTAAEVYLTGFHNGVAIRAAWAVEVLDISAQSLWPLSALTIWALEVPPDQIQQKLATLLAILSSARLEIDPNIGDLSWYGKIGQKWADTLGADYSSQ